MIASTDCWRLLPANDAASLWWMDPTTSRPNGVTTGTNRGRPLRPHLTHLISSNLFTHLIFSPRWCPRPVQHHPPPDPVPPSCPLWASPYNLSSDSSSSVTLFFHPKERPLQLSVSLLPHLFSLLIQTGIEPHLGLFPMHGVRPIVPPPLLQDPLPSRLPAAGPKELPHMLHHSFTCSAHQGPGVLRLGTNSFNPLVRGLPLPAVPLHLTQLPSPDEHRHSRTHLRER